MDRRVLQQTRPRGLLLVIALATLATGCTMLPAQLQPSAALVANGIAYPDGCREFELSDRQCEYIVDELGERLGVDRTTVGEIRLLGDPGCGDDPTVICARTMEFVVRIRFLSEAAPASEDAWFCGVGGENTLGCTDPPQIRLAGPTLSGYQDIPCAGEPPDCASPVPTIDPAMATNARPFELATLDIPLDHVGHYGIPLGTAVLPNGVLTDGSFALADDLQRDFLLADSVVRLVVTDSDGEPIWNVYEQGWQPGAETVEVGLEFDVDEAAPGAVLQVRDVVVR